MAIIRSGVPKGIKHKKVMQWERDSKVGGPIAHNKLSYLLGEVSTRSHPQWQSMPRGYVHGPALAWANVSRLPVNEIATQIALSYLKANVNWKWPRKVTFADFEEKVIRPLIADGAKGYDGRSVYANWVLSTTPQSILRQAEIEVANSKRENSPITIKQALEGFWARPSRSGARGLTKAQFLSSIRFSRKPKKKNA